MSDFEDMTKDELNEIASSMDIEGRSSMTKDELVSAIKKQAKKGVESRLVTPVIPDPPEDPRPVIHEGNPDEGTTRDRGFADQSSAGGTGGGGFAPTGGVNPNPSGTTGGSIGGPGTSGTTAP